MIIAEKKKQLRSYSKKHLDKTDVLMIFAKYPYPGQVKTRLAKSIGNIKAAHFSLLCTRTILKYIRGEEFNMVIFYTPREKKREIGHLVNKKVELYPQKNGDLGQKLSHAFRKMFKKGAQRVIAIGTDCPLITNSIIREAFKKLKKTECVIGPSLDGGYYLLGLSSFHEEIFQNVNWGTDKVLKQTENNLKNISFSYYLLDDNFDIDRIDDAILLYEKIKGNKEPRFIPLFSFLKKCLYD